MGLQRAGHDLATNTSRSPPTSTHGENFFQIESVFFNCCRLSIKFVYVLSLSASFQQKTYIFNRESFDSQETAVFTQYSHHLKVLVTNYSILSLPSGSICFFYITIPTVTALTQVLTPKANQSWDQLLPKSPAERMFWLLPWNHRQQSRWWFWKQ